MAVAAPHAITPAFEYDADGRLLRQVGPRTKVTYGYDDGKFGAGRLARVEDESGSTRDTCNLLGQVTAKILTIKDGASSLVATQRAVSHSLLMSSSMGR